MPKKTNRSQLIARNTLYLYLRMFLLMAVTLYTSRVILQTLGFEDFGIYNVVGTVVTFLSFLQAALRFATFRHITFELGLENKKRLRTIYSMAINSHLILAIIIFVLMEIGGVWFLNNKMVIPNDRVYAANWTYQISLLSFFIGIFRTPFDSNIIAHEKMDFFAMTSILEAFLKLSVAYMLTILPYDKLISYSFLLLIISLSLFIWYFLYCKINFKDCTYIKCWDKQVLIKFVNYSGWSLLVDAATITRTQSIIIFFNLFLGVIANAALGIANQVVAALYVFVKNFTQAYKPQIIKSWAAEDFNYFMKIIFSSSKLSYYLLLWVSIPIIINITFVLHIWLGNFPSSAPVFVLTIILYYLIDAQQAPLVAAVHATGNLKFHQIMIASITIIMIPIAYLMLYFGYSGAMVLVANFIINLISAITRIIYMRHLIKLNLKDYCHRVVLPILLVTSTSFPIPIYISQKLETSWRNVIIETILSLVITAFSCYFIGLNEKEKGMLKSIPIVKKLSRSSS